MPTWKYDSHCNDNVFDYINDFDKKELLDRVEDDMWDLINFEDGENNLEFILGISLYCIRNKFQFSKKFILKLRDIIDLLLTHGEFKGWINKESRKNKLKHERLILNNILVGKELKFSKLEPKPTQFTDLNSDY